MILIVLVQVKLKFDVAIVGLAAFVWQHSLRVIPRSRTGFNVERVLLKYLQSGPVIRQQLKLANLNLI